MHGYRHMTEIYILAIGNEIIINFDKTSDWIFFTTKFFNNKICKCLCH